MSTTATATHWAAEYKPAYDASSNRTLEGCIYMVAGYVVSSVGQEAEHERVCRGIAQIAFDQKCCIWHASWLFHGQRGDCMCAPCTNSNKKGRLTDG